MTVDPELYWSIDDCGWRPGPGVDALATPWTSHEVGRPRLLPPADAVRVLRMSASPDVPQQREIIDLTASAVTSEAQPHG
jgi:hypothetical protein